MRCTAPCLPACDREATHELANAQSGAPLGHNCAEHALPLTRRAPPDYVATPLQPEAAE